MTFKLGPHENKCPIFVRWLFCGLGLSIQTINARNGTNTLQLLCIYFY